jgi:Domain of unknown function (DUF4381)
MTSATLAFSLLAAIGVAPANTPDPLAPLFKGGSPSTPPVEIRDIAPPIDVFPYPLWMVIVAGCIAAAVLGAIIWWFVRWMRRRPAPPPPTPRQIALRALEALRAQVREMEPYAFSIAVSDVLRTYVSAAYGLHAGRQTSPEFLAVISGHAKFSDADRSLLASFLERCDLIKFAHVDADAGDSGTLLERALAFAQGGVA